MNMSIDHPLIYLDSPNLIGETREITRLSDSVHRITITTSFLAETKVSSGTIRKSTLSKTKKEIVELMDRGVHLYVNPVHVLNIDGTKNYVTPNYKCYDNTENTSKDEDKDFSMFVITSIFIIIIIIGGTIMRTIEYS